MPRRADLSADPALIGLRGNRVWYGPVTLNRGSEPYMRIAVAGNRAAVGIAIAEINLTLIRDVVSAIRVGETGLAFVVDGSGALVAHPDISLMLRGSDEATARRLQALRAALLSSDGEPTVATDFAGLPVIAAAAMIEGLGWLVVVEQPTSEAYAPIVAAAWRTALLVIGASALALGVAYLLARRMTGPIRLLEEGAAAIGAGRFDHQINIRTGDELERLAESFNQMAGDLALSQERSERIARLKRFLSPQVADIVERSGDIDLLAARRADVVVVFADLRGFTALSTKAAPEEIMRILGEYYGVLGACIIRNEATLTHFSGDGVMVLLNATLPCKGNPVLAGLQSECAELSLSLRRPQCLKQTGNRTVRANASPRRSPVRLAVCHAAPPLADAVGAARYLAVSVTGTDGLAASGAAMSGVDIGLCTSSVTTLATTVWSTFASTECLKAHAPALEIIRPRLAATTRSLVILLSFAAYGDARIAEAARRSKSRFA